MAPPAQAAVHSQMHVSCSRIWRPRSRSSCCYGTQGLSLSSRRSLMIFPLSTTVSDSVGSPPCQEPGREVAGSFPEPRRAQAPRMDHRVGTTPTYGQRASGQHPREKSPRVQRCSPRHLSRVALLSPVGDICFSRSKKKVKGPQEGEGG